ncbi:GDP-L-fucose synthase family protein [Qipengyuania seohaensis]|uniref:GDP-L-fucose synthase family protein n=1 Tax=Qipengyuania seohaensis TaxID=266951 RepID=UPI000C22B4B3|nr:GDP-L-fucose synthase [Qipengyuania seohaensis]
MNSLPYSLDRKRVYISGHLGMVGSAIVRRLESEDCIVLFADRSIDLREQAQVRNFFRDTRPEVVIVAAGKVGGILANSAYPAQFLYDNLMIAANTIHAAREVAAEKLLYLGSSCIYPREAEQPISEESLLSGPLEPTNEWYALAKIAGVKLCQSYRREYDCDFISAMPTNLYGPGDNYDPQTSHVLPALIKKAHEAKASESHFLEVLGSGKPKREFLHVDDLADACIYLLSHYSGAEPINVGSGHELSIAELANLVCSIVGFYGQLRFDPTMPDGTPRKRLDTSRLDELGWMPSIPLGRGIADTYASVKSEL